MIIALIVGIPVLAFLFVKWWNDHATGECGPRDASTFYIFLHKKDKEAYEKWKDENHGW